MDHAIHPTGKCFDDALDLMMDILRENHDLRHRLYLVHGITTVSGKQSAHAWLEMDRRVFFVGILDGVRENFAAPRSRYYAELMVIHRTRYLYDEMFRLNRQSGNYGPWEERYKGLCRDSSVATDFTIKKIGPLDDGC